MKKKKIPKIKTNNNSDSGGIPKACPINTPNVAAKKAIVAPTAKITSHTVMKPPNPPNSLLVITYVPPVTGKAEPM